MAEAEPRSTLESECDEIAAKAEASQKAQAKKEEEEKAKKKQEEEENLPKLSAADFRTYNRLAEHMDYFVSLLFYLFYFTLQSPLLFFHSHLIYQKVPLQKVGPKH